MIFYIFFFFYFCMKTYWPWLLSRMHKQMEIRRLFLDENLKKKKRKSLHNRNCIPVDQFKPYILKGNKNIQSFCSFYTPSHNSGGVLWFHVGRPSVRPSVRFSFPDDNLSKH